MWAFENIFRISYEIETIWKRTSVLPFLFINTNQISKTSQLNG